jgi:soluble lytic murein transglycosylase-like protein
MLAMRLITLCVIIVSLSLVAPPRPEIEIDPVDEALMPYIRRLLDAESNSLHTNRRGRVKVSHKGAIGKWQVMPDTSDFYWMKNRGYDSPDCLYNEQTNAMIGYWYLRYCFKVAGGDIPLTFTFYNMGHNTTGENVRYLKKICPEFVDD